MTDEENKAIDNFKKLDFFEYDWQFEDEDFETREDMLAYAEKMQKTILHLIEKQQNKIKELTKGNRSLMESRIKWKNRYYKEKAKNKECISKDKIREKIKDYDKWIEETYMSAYLESLQAQKYALEELLEEN